MSRRKKYEEEYEDEDYEEVDEEEEEEEDEESTMERVIAFYEDELERLVRDDPYNQEKFDMVMKRLEQLKKCRAVDCQAAESLANKEQAQQSMERIIKLAEGKTVLSGHNVNQ